MFDVNSSQNTKSNDAAVKKYRFTDVYKANTHVDVFLQVIF